jgi:Secretion system C-terminal sorting domain/SprB repeat
MTNNKDITLIFTPYLLLILLKTKTFKQFFTMKKLIFLFAFAFMQTTMQAQCSVSISAMDTIITCVMPMKELTAVASGGTAPYTYNWSLGGVSSNTITVVTPDTYTVTITDVLGCTATATQTILQNTAPPALQVIASNYALNCVTSSVDLVATSGNNTTYIWSDGVSTTNTIAVSSTGFYTVTATDVQNGCTSSSNIYVPYDYSPPALNISPQNVYLGCAANGTAVFTASGGDTYDWSIGITTPVFTTNTIGTYTVTATNWQSGCTTTATVNVFNGGTVPIVSFASTGSLCGAGSSLCANSTPNANFTWSHAGLGAGYCTQIAQTGIYTVTATTAQGCTATASINIGFVTNTVSVSITNPTNATNCYSYSGGATATASGGTAPYHYDWVSGGASDTVAMAQHLRYGTNTVVASDANGCTATQTVVIASDNFNNLAVIAEVTTLPTCSTVGVSMGNSTGGTLPYTYTWSSGYQGQNFIWPFQLPKTYTVTVQDANGCSAQAALFVSDTSVHFPIPTITQSAPHFGCGGNDTVRLTAVGGLPNYNYFWRYGNGTNSQTGISVNVTPYPIGFIPQANTYTVGVSGGDYCTTTLTATIRNVPNYLVYGNADDCSSQNTGRVSVLLAGEAVTLPDSYIWNTGATASYIENMPSGWYSVTMTLANCDTTHRNFYIPEICKTTISGYALKDNNSNCARDTTDTPLAYNGYVTLRNTQTQVTNSIYLDANGFYSAVVDTGYYQISYVPNTIACTQFTPVCTSANGISLYANITQSSFANQNFYWQPNLSAQPDVSVWASQQTARPVFPRQFSFYTRNNGTAAATNTTITFTHNSLWANLTMLYGGLAPISSTATSKTWNIGTLAQNANLYLNFTMELPQSTAIGTQLDYTVAINSANTDCNTNDNIYTWTNIASNSFDPNDKSLLNTQNEQGNILNDNAPLRYQIRFQNTGTDTAYTVVVRDTINLTHLDKTTFKTIAASHNMQATWIANNVIEFRFPNINLVDSLHNEPLSHGWLQFSIAPKANTPLYSTVHNSAAIFFDYNAPVITNTVQTQFVPFLGVEQVLELANKLYLQVTPNPTTGITYLNHENYGVITVTDILGKTLLSQNSNGKNTPIDITTQPAGTYFIHLKTSTGSITKKIVKM